MRDKICFVFLNFVFAKLCGLDLPLKSAHVSVELWALERWPATQSLPPDNLSWDGSSTHLGQFPYNIVYQKSVLKKKKRCIYLFFKEELTYIYHLFLYPFWIQSIKERQKKKKKIQPLFPLTINKSIDLLGTLRSAFY